MNPEAQAVLDKILAKSPEDLRKDEILFLRARRDFLKPHQKEEFKSVLETKPPKKETVKHGKSK